MSDQLDCFGSVVLHDAADAYCSNCQFFKACSEKVEEVRKEIAALRAEGEAKPKTALDMAIAHVRTSRKLASKKPAKTEAKVTPTIVLTSTGETVTLAKKAAEAVDRWNKKGFDLGSIVSGANPFKGEVKFPAMFVQAYHELREALGSHLVPRKEHISRVNELLRTADGAEWSVASLTSNYKLTKDALEFVGVNMVSP